MSGLRRLSDALLVGGRTLDSFHSVYRQDVLLPLQFETEFVQNREDCGEAGEGIPDRSNARRRRCGSRMGVQPSVFTVNSPPSAVRFTTGKSVQLPM
jgi:hypothetical protein